MRFLKNSLFFLVGILFFLCMFYACARIGSPQGGAYDYAPPGYVSSKPEPNAIDFKGKKIEILFDELVNIEKPGEKVIITPPQKKNPEIKASGKKITVELKDSLLPNTTYTFDFTDAITDNTEKNALEGFSFAFSTGEVVDSLVISGILLNAENLEPMPGILVGLHSNLDDSAFFSTPFLRTTKTNDRGKFWIRNVAPGAYHVFALNDINHDYHFDQPGEDIAFTDSIYSPSFEGAVRPDTVWADSLVVDTVREVKYTRFTPDDIQLFLFKEEFERQYLSRPTRADYTLTFNFNSAKNLNPGIRLLNQESGSKDWAVQEFSEDGKALTLWIKDSLIYNADTLAVEVDYLKSDSLNKLVQTKDTFSLALRKKKEEKKKKNEAEKIQFLGVDLSAQPAIDVFDTVKITFSEPIDNLNPKSIKFEQKSDTIWQPGEIDLKKDSLNPRIYYLSRKWPYDTEFRVRIDSATIHSIYEKWNNKLESTFKFRKLSDYGHLYVAISGNTSKGFGELLDSRNQVVRHSDIINGELVFINLKPGKYYLRYIEDENQDGKWTTGLYKDKRQPERVYYYSGFFDIKQNFEFEQSWDITVTPVYKQKPLEITKNKPTEKKTKHAENRNNSNNRETSRQSNSTKQSSGSKSQQTQTR